MAEAKPKTNLDFEFEWQETTEAVLRGMKKNRIKTIPIASEMEIPKPAKKAKEED